MRPFPADCDTPDVSTLGSLNAAVSQRHSVSTPQCLNAAVSPRRSVTGMSQGQLQIDRHPDIRLVRSTTSR